MDWGIVSTETKWIRLNYAKKCEILRQGESDISLGCLGGFTRGEHYLRLSSSETARIGSQI